jgi:vancomycin permeability regulator SanA
LKKIKIFYFLLLSFLAWFFIHVIYISIDGINDENKTADLAVILGTTVHVDGTLSKRLEERLSCGIQLYENQRIKKILVSGGLGKEGFYEGTEMKKFLVQKGIPEEHIFVDNHGNNTRLSVQNTMKLCEKEDFKSIIVVSQFFHLSRAKKLFKRAGFDNVSSVSPSYFEFRDCYSLFREFFAYYLN